MDYIFINIQLHPCIEHYLFYPAFYLICCNIPFYLLILNMLLLFVFWLPFVLGLYLDLFSVVVTDYPRLDTFKEENLEHGSGGWRSRGMVSAFTWPLVRALCCSPCGAQWEREQVGAEGRRESWTPCWLTCSWPSLVVLVHPFMAQRPLALLHKV